MREANVDYVRHPTTPGKCLRCGENLQGHSIQDCRRPKRDKPACKRKPKPGKGASTEGAEGDLAEG
eukprot:586385-Amphidinium_carterae.1